MIKADIEKGKILNFEYKGDVGEVLGDLSIMIDLIISDIDSKSNKNKEYILDTTVEELKKIWKHFDLENRVNFYEFNKSERM